MQEPFPIAARLGGARTMADVLPAGKPVPSLAAQALVAPVDVTSLRAPKSVPPLA